MGSASSVLWSADAVYARACQEGSEEEGSAEEGSAEEEEGSAEEGSAEEGGAEEGRKEGGQWSEFPISQSGPAKKIHARSPSQSSVSSLRASRRLLTLACLHL